MVGDLRSTGRFDSELCETFLKRLPAILQGRDASSLFVEHEPGERFARGSLLVVVLELCALQLLLASLLDVFEGEREGFTAEAFPGGVQSGIGVVEKLIRLDY